MPYLCLLALLILVACTTPRPSAQPDLIVSLRDPAAVKGLSRLGTVIESIPADRLFVVRLHGHVKPLDAAVELSQDSQVLFAARNCATKVAADPVDPHYGDQVGIRIAAVHTAWDIWRPVARTYIAIIDTGVDTTHPDLTNKIRRENGQVVSYSALSGNEGVISDAGTHGTMCAGIAAAQTNNDERIAGVAGWDGSAASSDTQFTQIMPVRTKKPNGSGSISDEVKGIRWAINNGAHVLNMSFTAGYSNEFGIPQCLDPWSWDDEAPLEAIINEAWLRDVIMVASAGNDGNDTPRSPAKLRGVIAVGATDLEDKLLGDPPSNHGSWVDVVAPGINPSLEPDNGYTGAFRGTSSAAPIVAGAAALIRSHNPNLNDVFIRHLLRTNVDPYEGPRIRQDGGRINVRRALEAAGKPRIRLTITPDTTKGGYPKPTGTVTMDPPPTSIFGETVRLETFEPAHIHLPPVITVPPGGTQTFEIDLVSVPDNPKATIIARGGGGIAAATLWMYPLLPKAIVNVLADQRTIRYGAEMAMDIALDSIPRTDIAVTLSSTHPQILQLPSEIFVAGGLTKRRLVLRAGRVERPVDVTLTASVSGGAANSMTVTVTP